MLKAAGGVSAASIGGGAVVAFWSGDASAVSGTGLNAGDVSVGTNDGKLNALTLAPDVTVSWKGQESKVATLDLTWNVSSTGTSETAVGQTPYSFSIQNPTKDGSTDVTMDTIHLLSANGGGLSASTFESSSDGGSTDTDVTISMDATLKDDGSNTITSKTDLLSATYTVTVTNEQSSVSASGTANTAGS